MKVATAMPLLAGKLAAPSLPGRVVARPRLFARLDAGVQGPVIRDAAFSGSATR